MIWPGQVLHPNSQVWAVIFSGHVHVFELAEENPQSNMQTLHKDLSWNQTHNPLVSGDVASFPRSDCSLCPFLKICLLLII